jgi:hypothetical protein
MAQPWQADFNEMFDAAGAERSNNNYWWWPAQRPYAVFPAANSDATIAVDPIDGRWLQSRRRVSPICRW